MREIRLSVITPVFNGRSHIEACLQNVVNQACPFAEHLIMDGGSTDGTPELVAQWANQYPHIRLISEKDRGQSDAMNKGISQAKGKIIGFLNVDDYYEPGVLNRVLEIFNDLPEPAFVCGNLKIINPDGSLKHFNRPNQISKVELLSNCFEWPYNPSAYFYHRSLHELTGPYNEENHLSMDYEFLLEAAAKINLLHVDETWGNFQNLESSKTNLAHSNDPQASFLQAEKIRSRYLALLNQNELLELESILKTHIPHGSQLKEKQKPNLAQRVITKIKQILGK